MNTLPLSQDEHVTKIVRSGYQRIADRRVLKNFLATRGVYREGALLHYMSLMHRKRLTLAQTLERICLDHPADELPPLRHEPLTQASCVRHQMPFCPQLGPCPDCLDEQRTRIDDALDRQTFLGRAVIVAPLFWAACALILVASWAFSILCGGNR